MIGAYSGAPEIGFKRYNEHLMKHWCAVDDKTLPVSWSTWLVTLEGNKPLMANYDREFLLEYIDHIKEAGFFDVLHLDLGWEADYPLQVDRSEVPERHQRDRARAKEAAGLDMTYWVNPFSASYWKSRAGGRAPGVSGAGQGLGQVRRDRDLRDDRLLRLRQGALRRACDRDERARDLLGRQRLEHPASAPPPTTATRTRKSWRSRRGSGSPRCATRRTRRGRT